MTRGVDRAECLAQTLVTAGDGIEVRSMPSIKDDGARRRARVRTFLAVTGSRRVTDPSVAEEIEKLVREFKPAPVLVLGDSDDIMQVLRALEIGARRICSFFPLAFRSAWKRSISQAGSSFGQRPLVGMRHRLETGVTASPPLAGSSPNARRKMVEALRRGKANKIIAYELKLRESTVKVHIRNIMKKLKATNRTEVACKVNTTFSGRPLSRDRLSMPERVSLDFET